jgi:hypothetical protein
MKRRGYEISYLDYNHWGRQFFKSMKDIQSSEVLHFICAIGCRKFFYIFYIRFILRKKVFVHFVGSDVLRLQKVNFFDRLNWTLALKTAHRVFTGAPWHVDEISDFIHAESFILFFNHFEKLKKAPPLPEKFTVLSYLPPGKPEFYGEFLVKHLVDKYPHIHFKIVGIDSFSNSPNVTSVPINYELDIHHLYKDVSLLIRLTEHDGYSSMVLEAMSLGRNIIWTYDIPHVMKTERNIKSVEAAIESSITKKLNEGGMSWVRKQFNFSTFLTSLEALYNNPFHNIAPLNPL